jgi:hypothetical protein
MKTKSQKQLTAPEETKPCPKCGSEMHLELPLAFYWDCVDCGYGIPTDKTPARLRKDVERYNKKLEFMAAEAAKGRCIAPW